MTSWCWLYVTCCLMTSLKTFKLIGQSIIIKQPERSLKSDGHPKSMNRHFHSMNKLIVNESSKTKWWWIEAVCLFLNEIYMSVYSVELCLCLVLLWIVYSSWRVVYNWYWLVMVVNNASCLMRWESTTLCVWHGITDGSQRRRKVRR